MKIERIIDPDCFTCHGYGRVMESVVMEDGVSCTDMDCHCVEYRHDDEARAFLASVTAEQRGH